VGHRGPGPSRPRRLMPRRLRADDHTNQRSTQQ
jgi:hypothetical protein